MAPDLGGPPGPVKRASAALNEASNLLAAARVLPGRTALKRTATACRLLGASRGRRGEIPTANHMVGARRAAAKATISTRAKMSRTTWRRSNATAAAQPRPLP